MKRIVLTGGGTAGHVMPNLALLPKLRNRGWEVLYVGSYDGMERALIEDQQIPYYPVATGKFRRYLSTQKSNRSVPGGKRIVPVLPLIEKLRPQVVFSKGGFVAVPVTIGAWLNRIRSSCTNRISPLASPTGWPCRLQPPSVPLFPKPSNTFPPTSGS